MGIGPDQRDLPGAVQSLPPEPRPRGHVGVAGLGVPRRRRDGRARGDGRAVARRARGARQPDLRRQLQPAAPRRSRPRQRQDHPGAGGALPRRRLERDQGHLGPRVGRAARPRRRWRPRREDEQHARRRVAEVLGRRRRVHPRALLRARPAAAPARRAPVRRRPRPSSAAAATTTARSSPRTRRRPSTRGAPTVDPRQDDQGLDARPGRRGSQHHPPDQEDVRGGAARSSATASSCRSRMPGSRTRPYYHPGPDSRGGPVPHGAARARSAGRCPSGSCATSRCRRRRPALTPSSRPGSPMAVSTTMVFTRLLRNLLRDPELGPRIVPIIPDEARTFGMDPLFKEVGIYAALGQRYEPVDSELVLSYREAKDGQVLEEGITEAGSMASLQAAGTAYATHGLRNGALLHLLLDVRLPADRRPDLGLRGRARPRLPDGRHRRPDDARPARASSTTTATRTCSPRPCRTSSPTTRPTPTSWRRSSATGSSGCTCRGDDVFYYITLYNEN